MKTTNTDNYQKDHKMAAKYSLKAAGSEVRRCIVLNTFRFHIFCILYILINSYTISDITPT